jgi:hypothetical protein
MVHIEVSETITVHESMRLKAREGGGGKPVIDHFEGADLTKRTGKWMEKVRRIDKGADRYYESVVDPESGIETHHCDEPLSDHRGHGSAKTSKESDSPESPS